ncbi:MAG: stage III sporulation protein AF, partial [Oscillospiraceae bacterium]|nr:stage III sporulation protein AF [Oscillospiraceae bacterium]
MEYIKAYVLSVAGVMIASTLIEAIMPATAFKKYIKTALGLVILITLAKPVLKLSDFDKLMEKYISFENTVDFSDKQAFAEEQTDKIIKAEFEKNLCKTIKDDVKNNL